MFESVGSALRTMMTRVKLGAYVCGLPGCNTILWNLQGPNVYGRWGHAPGVEQDTYGHHRGQRMGAPVASPRGLCAYR